MSCLLSLFAVCAAHARTSRRSPQSTYDPVCLPRRRCRRERRGHCTPERRQPQRNLGDTTLVSSTSTKSSEPLASTAGAYAPPADQRFWIRAIRGIGICVLPILVALYVGATTFGGSFIPWHPNMVDLEVYRRAGSVLLAGGDFYDLSGQLQFLYPPVCGRLGGAPIPTATDRGSDWLDCRGCRRSCRDPAPLRTQWLATQPGQRCRGVRRGAGRPNACLRSARHFLSCSRRLGPRTGSSRVFPTRAAGRRAYCCRHGAQTHPCDLHCLLAGCAEVPGVLGGGDHRPCRHADQRSHRASGVASSSGPGWRAATPGWGTASSTTRISL